MGGAAKNSKKRDAGSPSQSDSSDEDSQENQVKEDLPGVLQSLKPMERQKKRRCLDKERRQSGSDKQKNPTPVMDSPQSNLPGFHVDVFRDLASSDSSVRQAAAERLVVELIEVQRVLEKLKNNGEEVERPSLQMMEAEKDDGLDGCAPSLRYAIRRLVRGVSSSRECARQGFALGLTLLVANFPSIKVDSLLKLIDELLEVSSSMKGQEARECLLGRLFAYGSLSRSGRVAAEWIADNTSSCIKDFISHIVFLAGKKRYLREPAVAVILDMVDKLPAEALTTQVLDAPGLCEWFQNAAEIGDPDALFLALKLHEKVASKSDKFGKLLPFPFNSENLFTRDRLLYLSACFKESTFCLPRVHSLWPVLVNMLIPEAVSNDVKTLSRSTSSKKHKKNRKGGGSEEITKHIQSFSEVVIEESLLLSSHDRKHLAFDVILLLLPRLPASCIDIVISHKLVHCLMDILSTKSSLLYNAAQHFLKELVRWAMENNDKLVSVILSLQKQSGGRFDCITRTQTVKELVGKFTTAEGCLLFIHNLISLFIDDTALADEPSDQSETTDENSELGSADSPGTPGSTDSLKDWVIDAVPRVLKNLKVDTNPRSLQQKDVLEARFRVQTEIMKFLTVQGLFSASLGTEVTSFELQEKFKWPKAVTSGSLCRKCIEQLQSLLEDAQKGEGTQLVNGFTNNDLGSFFMRFINTLCNIPSVSLFRSLNKDDEKAFKKLLGMESRLFQEERNIGPGPDANKLHAMRYLLIQLLLQVLLQPGDYSDAALELVICCKKAFPAASHGDSEEEEDDFGDNGSPELMDVLIDTLLQLLPHSSGPTCFAIEQVFIFFCDNITEGGLLQMSRIVKRELKSGRHQAASSDPDDDEDDDDVIGLEEKGESDEAESAETGDSEGKESDEDEASEMSGSDKEVNEGDTIDSDKDAVVSDISNADKTVTEDGEDLASSEEYDDEKMFQIDAELAQMFKKGNLSGSGNPQAQFMSFKLRVLSLLEIYLQKNAGKPQVLMIYSYLARAFVNSHNVEGNKQLRERLGGILQKKIFKAKEYPKGDDIELATLENLLEKSLKTASRNRIKAVSTVAQASTFWLLKLIYSKNLSESELGGVFKTLQNALLDYFESKKCRLKSGFFKEAIRRNPWIVPPIFGFLLEKCRETKSKFRRLESLDIVDCIVSSWTPRKKTTEAEENSVVIARNSKSLKQHLPSLLDLIHELLSRLPEKQSRRAEIRRFCGRILQAVSKLKLKKSFLKQLQLKPDTYSLCESQLGDLFALFKNCK